MMWRLIMKKKIPVIILLSLVAIICLYFSISAYIRYSEKYIDTYVASHNIAQRKQLKESDLSKIRVPKEYISEDVFTDKYQILNKYVKLSYSIPKGSLFYKGCLESDIKDIGYTLLNPDQIAYDLYTSEVKINPGTLSVNMFVDIYLTVVERDNTVSDLLIENCRIIGLYDYEGKLINQYDKESRVNIVSLALEKSDIGLLNKALKIGNISVLGSTDVYDMNRRSSINKDSEVFKYFQ